MTCLDHRTARGALSAMTPARARVSSMSRAAGTTRLIRPKLQRPRRVDRLAGEGELQGDGDGESLGEADEATGPGDEPPLGLGDAEGGVVGGHHEVARRA